MDPEIRRGAGRTHRRSRPRRNIKLSICTGAGEDVPPLSDIEGTCTEARNREIPAPIFVLVDRTWTCFAPHHDSVNEYGVLVKDRTHTYVFHWFFLTCQWESGHIVHRADAGNPDDVRRSSHASGIIEPLQIEDAIIEAVVVGNDAECRRVG